MRTFHFDGIYHCSKNGQRFAASPSGTLGPLSCENQASADFFHRKFYASSLRGIASKHFPGDIRERLLDAAAVAKRTPAEPFRQAYRQRVPLPGRPLVMFIKFEDQGHPFPPGLCDAPGSAVCVGKRQHIINEARHAVSLRLNIFFKSSAIYRTCLLQRRRLDSITVKGERSSWRLPPN